jgi:hypothetical protein
MRLLLIGFSFVLAVAAQAQPPAADLERAYQELVAAQGALQKAHAAREAGVEPQEGERLGTVGGKSRLADGYWERQKRLAADVERARERLDEAVKRWNEVR